MSSDVNTESISSLINLVVWARSTLWISIHLEPLLHVRVLSQKVACEEQRRGCGLVPSQDEDKLVSENLILGQNLVLASGLDTKLERVYRGHRRGVGDPVVQHLPAPLYDHLVGPLPPPPLEQPGNNVLHQGKTGGDNDSGVNLSK